MTDIVERLSAPYYWLSCSSEGHKSENGAPFKAADEITRLRAEVVRASQQLGDILAIIHRDGGHHTADVGIDQSVKDAHIKWASLMTENESLRAALRAVMDDLTLIGENHWLPIGLLNDVIYVNARAALKRSDD